ncbi:hypothetical protein [Simkania negevensis]|uniref:Uncharacterized protein n=1 Tax=Simkania negevensis (strain ATCC VR-1471 / DSM 27360 / Z) TaxID=331113 RepID=F8L340_SIMNZ|nr:hypothetical protein [Simkania negevensis]CCB89678.1 unknown protein [Simkania negevensis Z]
MTRRVHKRHSPPQLNLLPLQDSKQSSSLSKRRIEEKRSFFDSTMGKVIAVSLIFLATVVPFIGLAMYGTTENHVQTTASRLAGESFIVFFDDQEYSKAIEADHKRPGAFRDYLVKAYKHIKALNEIEDFPGPV